MVVYKDQEKKFSSFDGKFNQNYLTVIGNYFNTYILKGIFSSTLQKTPPPCLFSILAIYSITMDLKLLTGKCFI